MPDLSEKQAQFVREYLIDMNATQAAIRAGYAPKTAYSQGSRLLKYPEVENALRIGMDSRALRTRISADSVLEELVKIGFANMLDYMSTTAEGDAFVDLSTLTRDQAAAISEVTVEDFKDGRGEKARDVRRVKFRLLDKRAALADIGKHLGMFVDRREVTGKDGGPIEVAEISAADQLKAFLATKEDDPEPG